MTGNRTGVTIVTASAVVAVLAMVTPLVGAGQPAQLIAVLGGVILGPGSLAYRLATGSAWAECLTIGVALNLAAVMMIALAAVSLHFWHPKIELIIPAVTCALAVVLYRRPPSPRDDRWAGD
jgi:phosphatidylserine synthase